ncbi:MAG: transglycosylase domain-containing protein [Clostridia bacterium]|nr:transglycosylase domain-containing protein [Clostridia bacterium]
MDKLFKKLSLFLTIIITFSSLFTVFSVLSPNSESRFDFFEANDIVNNIKNLEMNMTSVIYVQDSQGAWVEYQRLHGNENRIWVSIDKMPKQLINAFIAIEDQRFYSHTGVDWKRTGAAFINWLPNVNILAGNQGGSTLTQQLIKNITSDNEQDAKRKFREIIRALTIEKIMDKKSILEAYLNTISLGNGICGVQVASNYYFNKDVSELSLVECACLAGITKNPSAYNPISFKSNNDERRRLVLDEMNKQGYINDSEYIDAYNAEITIDNTQKKHFEIDINNYFVDALIDDIIADLTVKYDCSTDTASSMLYNGGYKIYATMDREIQSTMENVYSNVPRYFSQRLNGANVQSSMTITDYQGHIVGIVGGAGEKKVNRGLNRATSAPRQPGSTMKPMGVYAPAIDNGTIYYSSIIEDKPLEKYYKDGKPGPKEWYGYYAGNMTVPKAIERSANTIPCHILKDLGVEYSFDFLTKKLGLKHLVENDKNISSLALGGCSYGVTTMESAAAYAVFGNGGIYYEPTTYYKVERPNGEIVLSADSNGQRAIKQDTAYIMNKLLQGVVYGSQGTGSGIRHYSSMKAYAKTGTSSESNDLWMVAGTPYYVGSVWYGFDSNGTIYNQGAAARIWNTVMTDVHKGLEYKEFEGVDELTEVDYCYYSGKLLGPKCYRSAKGYFVSDHQPEVCDGKHVWFNSESSKTTSKTSSATSSNTSNSSAVTSKPTESAVESGVVSETSKPNTSVGQTSDSTYETPPIIPQAPTSNPQTQSTAQTQ